jgi:thiol-disulfide isomerase/thioredoxin
MKVTTLHRSLKLFLTSFFLICTFIKSGNAQQIPISDSIIIDGYLSRKQLENYSWFSKNYPAYAPKKSIIRKLKKQKPISILIILGTWCSDSKAHVPAMLKVCEEAGIDQIIMIGVNRKKESSKVNIGSYQVTYVPLIIVYRNNKEIGRIIETPKKSVEEDLLKIIR